MDTLAGCRVGLKFRLAPQVPSRCAMDEELWVCVLGCVTCADTCTAGGDANGRAQECAQGNGPFTFQLMHPYIHPCLKAQISHPQVTSLTDGRARIKTQEWLASSLFLNLLNHTVSLLLTLAGYWDCLAAASPGWCLMLAPLPSQLGCQLKGIQSTNVLFLDPPILLRPLLWRMTSLTSFTLFAVPNPDSVEAIAWVNCPMEWWSRCDVFISIWTRAVVGICRTFQMNIEKSIF